MTITEDMALSRLVAIPADATASLPQPTAARALLTGAPVDLGPDAPAGYAVAAFQSVTSGGVAEVATLLSTPTGALSLMSTLGGYFLLPCATGETAADIVRDLHACLDERTWIGVAWGARTDLTGARATAADVVTVGVAGARDPGVYELRDVLADFAVLRQPSVSGRLIKIIEPIIARPLLLEALRAFLAEDGNRARAARCLLIHRSTLDYRLRAIERLTGARPTSPHGLLTLDAALTAHALTTTRPELPVV